MRVKQKLRSIDRSAGPVLIALPLALLACLAPASAAAAVTETHLQVLSPAGTYLVDDEVTPAETISVSGTSDGVAGERLDIKCYSGQSSAKLAVNVEVQAGGGFSFSGTMRPISDEACVLRAVPHGDATQYTPGSPSPFVGPTLAIGQRENRIIASGLNAGTLESFDIYDAQLTGAFDYFSLGGCTIGDSYVFDPVTFESVTLDFCNAWFNSANGTALPPGYAAPTRSELQVDKANAYLAANAGFASLPGYPALSYNYSIDPATGDLVLEETDTPVKCSPGGAYPPSTETCTSFVPTGVKVLTRVLQGQGGRAASVTQWFSSTDGQPHQLDLLEDNEFDHPQHEGELEFPWTGEGLKEYRTVGQVLPGASTAPGSFFVKGAAKPADGSEETAVGAVTFAVAPEAVTIVGTTNDPYSWVDLTYRRTVPAGGSVALGFTYSDAFLRGEVNGDAAAAQAAYVPSVAIAAPGTGSVVGAHQVTVSGSATDRNGLTSLLVNGQSVPVDANGGWAATVPLSAGANTITAVATNVFGDTAQAQSTVTYLPLSLTLAHVTAKSNGVLLKLTCRGAPGQRCGGKAVLSSVEHFSHRRLTAVSERRHRRAASKQPVTVGKSQFALSAGQTESVLVSLNSTGRKLLARFHTLPLRLQVIFTNPPSGRATVIARRTLSVKAKPRHKRHHK
jgi:hypothetical protein